MSALTPTRPVEAPAPRPRSSIAGLPAHILWPELSVATGSSRSSFVHTAPGYLCPCRHSQAVKPPWFGRTLTQYLVSEQLTRTSAELGLADHHCGRLGVGSVAPAQGLAWASEAVCLDFSEALPRYSSNNHCSCARPALTQAHVAKSWPWAWLQVLQNSRSQMFMLSVETPVSMRYPLALTKYKKKTLHRVQQYKSTCFSAQKATD